METGQVKRVTGLRQVTRAMEQGVLLSAVIAEDADAPIKEALIAKLQEANIPSEFVPSMKELGQLCGINVGAAVMGRVQSA